MSILRDSVQTWVDEFMENKYRFLFTKEYFHFLASKGDEGIEKGLKDIIDRPIKNFDFYNYYYYVMWYKALKNAAGEDIVNILEVASGDEDMIPQVMDRIYNKESQYVSFNMNKKLTREFYGKTKELDVSVLVIEEDAKYIPDYFGPDYFNIVAFQHSINDVIQSILCHKEGIDTINSDWMKVLPHMIKIMQRELQEGTLEQHAKKEFLSLISNCIDTLTQNGMMIFSHYMFQLDLDLGYPYELWHNMLPMARKWILESGLMVEEIEFEGFDKQWWMFLRKKLN
jgi:hypothetical protein